MAAEPPATLPSKIRDSALLIVEAIAALFVILLARRNWKLNRADRRGALYVASARLMLAAGAWVGSTHPVESGAMLDHFLAAAGDWLLSAFIMWVVYLALEPAVRARWPHSIVTWNRVLSGRWRDPQVWADVLIGVAAGSAMWIVFRVVALLTEKGVEPVSRDISFYALLGTRQWIGSSLDTLGGALRLGLIIFLAMFGLRRLLCRDWLAVLAASFLFTLTEQGISGPDWLFMTAMYVVVYAALLILLLRCGLIATIVAIFFVDSFSRIALGADWKTWYTPAGLAALFLLLGIAVYAFWRSLGSRELIGEEGTT